MNKKICSAIVIALLCITGGTVYAQKYEKGLIDKTIALVGNDMIMLSNLEAEAQMRSARGITVDQTTRCEILEDMLISKLFLVQAKLDSLSVSAANVEAQVDQRMNETIMYLGGEQKVEEYFGKPIYKLRQEWREQLEDQGLIQEMQRKVAGTAPKLTPKDVENFYKNTLPEDLPMVSTKYRLRQIVLYPDKKAAEIAVKEKLIELRERVVKGERFSTLARLYSEDPGSLTKGGELGMASKSIFWPAFSDAATALKVGQVSQVVETPDGFHIIQLIERQGDMFNARHILIKPKYTTEDRVRAFNKLDSIRTEIVTDSLSFFDAARKYSQDTKTIANGGLMADENTGSSYFEKDQLKPADYNILRSMKEGDISEPFESLDNEGRNGNTIYKIICLEKIIPAHQATFKDDYNDLLNQANGEEITKVINEFVENKQKTTYLLVDPMFHGCQFTKKGWIK